MEYTNLTIQDRLRQAQIQGKLCGVLHSLADRLDTGIINYVERMMQCFLLLIKNTQTSVYEKVVMAIDSVVRVSGENFKAYLEDVHFFLTEGLNSVNEPRFCRLTITTISNITHYVKNSLPHEYFKSYIEILIKNLSTKDLDPDLKIHILSAFADFAVCLPHFFENYLDTVGSILKKITFIKFDSNDELTNLVYLTKLRKTTLEVYTGIILGLNFKKRGKLFLRFIEQVIFLLEQIAKDPKSELFDELIKNAVELIVDILSILSKQVKRFFNTQPIYHLINHCLESDDQKLKKIGGWDYKLLN
ncbi:importin subunit beta-1 [Anaeramoeba flamelloides]|uniref:Importin subunit beta-1 n=1 Tax=Anaeramoeba flamelloides TaxID=1746091 RepID=A0AAV7Z9R4_9EUKA|nr:importin subunit beta-1 [Anaeramoeba flamelloides]